MTSTETRPTDHIGQSTAATINQAEQRNTPTQSSLVDSPTITVRHQAQPRKRRRRTSSSYLFRSWSSAPNPADEKADAPDSNDSQTERRRNQNQHGQQQQQQQQPLLQLPATPLAIKSALARLDIANGTFKSSPARKVSFSPACKGGSNSSSVDSVQ